jgi:hypothetical protein
MLLSVSVIAPSRNESASRVGRVPKRAMRRIVVAAGGSTIESPAATTDPAPWSRDPALSAPAPHSHP